MMQSETPLLKLHLLPPKILDNCCCALTEIFFLVRKGEFGGKNCKLHILFVWFVESEINKNIAVY